MLFSNILGAALAIAAPATETAINTQDTKVFEQQLRDMGYKPDPFTIGEGTSTTSIRIGEVEWALVLGGCTKGTACSYVVLVNTYTDVIKPPLDWLARMNGDYDLIKVWTRDTDHALSYSAGAIINGLPRASFQQWTEQVQDSGNDLAAEAVKAKLIKE